ASAAILPSTPFCLSACSVSCCKIRVYPCPSVVELFWLRLRCAVNQMNILITGGCGFIGCNAAARFAQLGHEVTLLDNLRRHCPGAVFLNASTNKVYGKLRGVEVRETPTRYAFANGALGISELQPLDFHSPYGCSKGAADQYTMDYARIYGLRTVNFRQSCIYGLRQFGVEDQGWVAWFTIAHELGKQIKVYGTGKQVRDLLSVEDLVD